jgi:hypothetical protein
MSVQVTFDGGSELGWLAAFQTTSRWVFDVPASRLLIQPVTPEKPSHQISQAIFRLSQRSHMITSSMAEPSGMYSKRAVFILSQEM